MNGVLVGNVYQRHHSLPNGGAYRRPRACSTRVILSLSNKRTTAEALKRVGLTCLASEAGAASHPASRSDWRGLAYRPQSVSFSTIFGGSPSCAAPATQGLAFVAFRMQSAPLTLDPSANPQEGGA